MLRRFIDLDRTLSRAFGRLFPAVLTVCGNAGFRAVILPGLPGKGPGCARPS